MGSSAAVKESFRPWPARFFVLLGRLYLPAAIASPFAAWSSVKVFQLMTGEQQGTPAGVFSDLKLLLIWSIMLFGGALMIGLPLASLITRVLQSWLARAAALVVLGGTVHVVPGLLVIARDTAILYSAPAGAFMALCCCVVNFDKLRQPRPRLV